MNLTHSDVEKYHRDGYLLVENVFTQQEVDYMLHEIEHGEKVSALTAEMSDKRGRKAKLAIWEDLTDDIWSAVSTCPRIANSVRILLGEEISFYHGKVMLKKAHEGGAWEWHQDYGYWYPSFMFPHMISAFTALDEATSENGCLKVLKGSHKLGRIDHGMLGGQLGADLERLMMVEQTLEQVEVQMKPGSVLFFHCNLLHASGPNLSDQHRRSFIVCYNALSNPCTLDQVDRNCIPVPAGSDKLF
ncbi:phytanoyl-CoA dioxygenase family protein [Paenibacillus montanisoli]|uniref:phytanoyl-CoA dioxygenase family protein n=1 Tax=Paenibacillus montanisoli TaxID=2081970 RepID=UPI001402B6BA|nr:phytanoyl-CoA dioxygenase family protein [Paenibacillus montanisoli]